MAGEPTDRPGRLIPVRMLIRVVLVLMLGASLPAVAQEQAQVGPSLEASVGLDGFVAAGRPAAVTASISTPILIAGRLRVRGGGIAVSRPVEVPAGGEQAYELVVPSLDDGSRLTVEVLDGDDDVLVTETVTVRSAFDELAVGIVGNDDLVAPLARVRTIITDRPVAPLVVAADAPASAFDVLSYLILTRDGSERLGEALDWATTGGALILDPTVAAAADLPSTPLPTDVEGVTSAPIGVGRVVVVTGMEDRTGDEWAAILRPATLDLGNSPEWGMGEQGAALLQAASESGSRQVPSLPWLLFAILGFALLVGPVNFIVLSKLGKRDWAWVTIPAVALVAVIGFWVAGRQRIAGTTVTHASIVVSDGSLEARSAVIVAAGVSGERQVSFATEASVFPERSTFGGSGSELRLEGDNSVRVELDQLGFTGVGLVTARPEVSMPTVSFDGETVSVANSTNLAFWGWGVMRGASSVVAPADLSPGGDGSVAVPGGINQFGFGFVDSLINERQLWDDPQKANSLWSFGQALASTTDDAGLYFVALTDEYEPTVEINGAAVPVPGTTVFVVRLGTVDAGGIDPGVTSVGASVVGTGFINWLDWSSQHVVATDELTVSFNLPDPNREVRFRDSQQFGVPADQYLAWDWTVGEFVDITRNEPLPTAAVSPDGQVYVRLVGAEFGDNPFSPDSLSLEWDA